MSQAICCMSAHCLGRLGVGPLDAWTLLTMLMAQVDNAEPIPVWIFQHNEVRILRVAVPVDPPGTERHETRGFCLLLADIGDVQVKVQARVSLRRGLAELEGYCRSSFASWHKHPRPSAEPVLAQLVAQCCRPE